MKKNSNSSGSGDRNIVNNSFIQREFMILDRIGEGAYGVVYSAQERKTGRLVAIKKIQGACDRLSSCKRTYRELKLLSLLKHENVIPLRHVVAERSKESRHHESKGGEGGIDIYAIFDLMETDLTSIIKSPQHLSTEHCQFFIYQVLRGLKYCHSANVIHRDLKPRNLLVNSTCDLRICDFGLARLDIPELVKDGECMTDYVATRWYRPPEVVVSAGTYTKALDMWAVGCILAELLLRKPIFPGADQHDLLKRICEVLGPIPDSMINKARNEKLRAYLKTLSYHFPKPIYPLRSLLRGCCPEALDLVEKLLVVDPNERLTVYEALEHPFLASLYCPEDEPTRERIDNSEFAFEFAKDLTIDHLKVLIQKKLNTYAKLNGTDTKYTATVAHIHPSSKIEAKLEDDENDEEEEKKSPDTDAEFDHVQEKMKNLAVSDGSNNNQRASPSMKKSPMSNSHSRHHVGFEAAYVDRSEDC